MSVKSFKFVSPGVFINEIDNSFIPRSAEAIGPVVIGRAAYGPAMEPQKVQSFSEFINLYGDTVPGNGGGDVYRNGNMQAPMYGTYAAKAFLNANVAPLTYMRLLGFEHTNRTDTDAAKAGWKTIGPDPRTDSNGGAYGLWVFDSASVTFVSGTGGTSDSAVSGAAANLGTGSLAAVWYMASGSAIALSGATMGLSPKVTIGAKDRLLPIDTFRNSTNAALIGTVIKSDSNGRFTVRIGTDASNAADTMDDVTLVEETKFSLDDNNEDFIRNVFNTNPQLASTAGAFYPASARKPYWLGETFEQYLRYGGSTVNNEIEGNNLTNRELYGVILPIARDDSATDGPHSMLGYNAIDGNTGWFIGQDLKSAGVYTPESAPKLFRLVGRGHGEWLQRNLKVSIEKIRASAALDSDYGSFSVVIRMLGDTDSNVQVVERFDNCNLNPSSPNYVARKIGTVEARWSDSTRRLTYVGDYPNASRYVRVEMNEDVDNGATDPKLLPFGYAGPPSFTPIGDTTTAFSGSSTAGPVTNDRYLYIGGVPFTGSNATLLSGSDTRLKLGIKISL